MNRGNTESQRLTGRRGFFRQLALAAAEAVENAGREMADRSLAGFREPRRYTPPPLPADYYRHLSPQYTVLGPPWPPTFGPYVSPELRKTLREAREAEKRQQQGGQPVPQDDQAP